MYQNINISISIYQYLTAGGIGFLNDSRRLNVAITRAKCSLFLLGKSSNLLQNPLWRSLIEDFKKGKCLFLLMEIFGRNKSDF